MREKTVMAQENKVNINIQTGYFFSSAGAIADHL